MSNASSLVTWQRNDICPSSLILTSSGSRGARLIFWHERNDGKQHNHDRSREGMDFDQSDFNVSNEASQPDSCVVRGVNNVALLSVLHPVSQSGHSCINLQLGETLFIGRCFNLSPESSEIAALSHHDSVASCYREDGEDSSDEEIRGRVPPRHRGSQTISSFSLVFVFKRSAPVSIRRVYSELARQIGVQLRRAEIFWSFLSRERTLAVFSVTVDEEANLRTPRETEADEDEEEEEETAVETTPKKQPPATPASSTAREEETLEASEETVFVAAEGVEEPASAGLDSSCGSRPRSEETSRLGGVLRAILDSACDTGHINVKLCKLYPVFFTVPHRAYCFEREAIPSSDDEGETATPNPCTAPLLGIRPQSVWRALDNLRPYHSLVLLRPKKVIVNNYLPSDTNLSLLQFLDLMSPCKSLLAMSECLNSQQHCLRLASWLVLRGHAVIVYPVVGNNVYTLAPQSQHWLVPGHLQDFAYRFPRINLAELLSSFSAPLSLQEHMASDDLYAGAYEDVDLDDDGEERHHEENSDSGCSSLQDAVEPLARNAYEVARRCCWKRLRFPQIVNLIAWLLSHRLLVQLHTYAIPTTAALQLHEATTREDAELAQLIEVMPQELQEKVRAIFGGCTLELRKLLYAFWPEKYTVEESTDSFKRDFPHDSAEEAQARWAPFGLFLNLLPRLPAHVEELIFVESTTRSRIISCIERFHLYITTAQMPDPVSSVFVGIDFPKS